MDSILDSKVSNNTPINLSKEQKIFVEAFVDFANRPLSKNPTENIMFLLGKAGTGKTFAISAIPVEISENIIFTAMTNKASLSLRQAVKKNTSTTASALNLVVKTSIQGEQGLEQTKKPAYFSKEILLIDEISFISPEYMGYLFDVLETNKILFVGDSKQTPYVNITSGNKTEISPVFDLMHPDNTVELTEVLRFGGDLQIFTDLARNSIKGRTYPLQVPPKLKTSKHIEELQIAKLQDSFRNNLQKFREGAAIAVAWRNATVSKLNQTIRELLYPEVVAPIVSGERLIVTKPYGILVSPKEGFVQNLRTISELKPPDILKDLSVFQVLSIDTIFEVISVEQKSYRLFSVEYNNVSIRDEFGKTAVVRIPTQDGRETLKIQLDTLREELKSLKDYGKKKVIARLLDIIPQLFLSTNYAYALTTHRVQGLTKSHCYVVVDDFIKNRRLLEQRLLLYVAYSRASDKLTLVKGVL